METSEEKQRMEISVSHLYVLEHGWVVNAMTGFLSAFYMEDPRFRVSRRYQEQHTGMHVWVCEIEGNFSVHRLIKRLQRDIPPCQVREEEGATHGLVRHVIDVLDFSRQAASDLS